MNQVEKSCRVCILFLFFSMVAFAQRTQTTTSANRKLVQGSLISPGSTPFHLQAAITDGDDQSPSVQIEMFWVAPDKFRRTIQSSEFSQTLVVNGGQTFEQNSDDYFPLKLRTLITAMVDPQPVLDALRPGDALLTKANGAMKESGLFCPQGNKGVCIRTRYAQYGLMEIVGASGHSVAYINYKNFGGKRVARIVTNDPRLGESLLTLKVTKLEKLRHPNPALFTIESPTSPEKQIRTVRLPEARLRSLAIGPTEIIWPQPLDGANWGAASFYISVDVSGHVREVIPLYTVNERTNDSAQRQLMTWRFKPALKDGYPAQAEGILRFTLNTRAWGPPYPLTDSEIRKLASNTVEPDVPAGAFPPGTVYTLRVAIDSDGKLIEAIAGQGPPALFLPCYKAVSKWRFRPILDHGSPRPYRGQIEFHIQ